MNVQMLDSIYMLRKGVTGLDCAVSIYTYTEKETVHFI